MGVVDVDVMYIVLEDGRLATCVGQRRALAKGKQGNSLDGGEVTAARRRQLGRFFGMLQGRIATHVPSREDIEQRCLAASTVAAIGSC